MYGAIAKRNRQRRRPVFSPGTMAQQIVLCCAQRHRGSLSEGLPKSRRAVMLHPR
jgi:hypothetical protein